MRSEAAKGSAMAEVWIKTGTNGLQGVLGVLADPKSGTLRVRSSKLPTQSAPTALKSFDLKTGAWVLRAINFRAINFRANKFQSNE